MGGLDTGLISLGGNVCGLGGRLREGEIGVLTGVVGIEPLFKDRVDSCIKGCMYQV